MLKLQLVRNANNVKCIIQNQTRLIKKSYFIAII